MGSFKEKGHEGIREMQEHSKEASEVGEEIDCWSNRCW